jgi:hypothetical protein
LRASPEDAASNEAHALAFPRELFNRFDPWLRGNTSRMLHLAATNEPDEALEDQDEGDDANAEVFTRAKQRFDLAVLPQLETRALALAARRFVSIPGAQWEGDIGDVFDNAIKLEINLTRDGLEKIYRDYNENRIVPDFRPAGGKGDEESAATLDGLHRADSHCFKSQQARDNAFIEGTAGGFGAYRLTNEWADPFDKDSDQQRINPGLVIADADQRVFFDPDSKLYDKSDAKFAFVITAKGRDAFEEEYEGNISDWSVPQVDPPYDWFTPDQVKVAEYYEVEESTEKLLILTQLLSGEEQRYWQTEISDDELAEMKRLGWSLKTRNLKRKRVHKYVMSGEEILGDKGQIAGDRIPIAPYYGKRAFVDGIERFEGYVQGKMDVQRLYNMVVSKLAETSAQSPREIPIFAAQQMPQHLADLWARQIVDRHGYALVEPLIDPATGQMLSPGPIGKVTAATIDPSTAALIQVARNDLTADQQDGSEEVKANTSEEAMAFAATRVDAKSGIFLDNWRQTVQCEGEVYLSMSADIYYEAGREVETMDEEGNDGSETLVQPYVDPKGTPGHRNDFTRGHYKVVVDVTEATATRRDKTVKSCLLMAEGFQALDQDLALAAGITAVANMAGEGMTELRKYARTKGIKLGLIEPNEEEQAELDKAAANAQQQPDPQAEFIAAKTEEARASALDKTAAAGLKDAQATVVGGPEAAPKVPDGLDQAHKVAQIGKTAAETEHIRTQTAHLPQELAIEATNASANRMKARHSAFSSLAKLLSPRQK